MRALRFRRQSIVVLTGSARSLRLLLEHCHALSITADRSAMALEDDLGRALVHLRPGDAADERMWQIVTRSAFGTATRIVPVPDRPTGVPAQSMEPLSALRRMRDDIDAPGFLDTAELSGQVSLQLARLRREQARLGGKVVAVDPALVPHALRALTEDLLRIVVTVGCDALVLRRSSVFHAFKLTQGQARLTCQDTSIEIDVHAIDSAWVVGGGDGAGSVRQLRLYDADGRALAVIAPAPTHGESANDDRGREPRLWRTLMNALVS